MVWCSGKPIGVLKTMNFDRKTMRDISTAEDREISHH
jgi:hypothetical protein